MKRLLCIWLPNWPIHRLRSRLSADELDWISPAQPIVLWRSDARKGRLVVARCQLAEKMGVRVGMPIAEAAELAALSEQSPWTGLHDPVVDNQAIQQVAYELQKQISPLVAIESLDEQPWAGQPIHQPDTLLCDITGIAHLFGGEDGLLQAADEQLRQLGLMPNMAIADSVGAAWGLAHYDVAPRLRRGANRDSAPRDGVAGPQQGTQLGALPIEALRIPTDTVDTLTRLGITHMDQLLSLPRDGLATRLGNRLMRRIGQMLGEIDEPIDVHHAPAEDRQSIELEYATDDLAILADRMATLTEKIRTGLATRQRGALRLTCCLALADHPPLTFEIGFFAPTLDAAHMFSLMLGCIENRRLPGAVNRITISVTLSGPLRSSQSFLFQDVSSESPDSNSMSDSSLSKMLDSLSGRLGRDAVLGISPSQDPLPENAYEVHPLTGHLGRKTRSSDSSRSLRFRSHPVGLHETPSGSSNSDTNELTSDPSQGFAQPSVDDALRRPLNLLASPLPLAAIDSDPSNQLPGGFRLGGTVHRIARHWGPERIETGWWYGPSIRRDYYRIETDQGDWWWIYRNLTSENSNSTSNRGGQWMLHGRFA